MRIHNIKPEQICKGHFIYGTQKCSNQWFNDLFKNNFKKTRAIFTTTYFTEAKNRHLHKAGSGQVSTINDEPFNSPEAVAACLNAGLNAAEKALYEKESIKN